MKHRRRNIFRIVGPEEEHWWWIPDKKRWSNTCRSVRRQSFRDGGHTSKTAFKRLGQAPPGSALVIYRYRGYGRRPGWTQETWVFKNHPKNEYTGPNGEAISRHREQGT